MSSVSEDVNIEKNSTGAPVSSIENAEIEEKASVKSESQSSIPSSSVEISKESAESSSLGAAVPVEKPEAGSPRSTPPPSNPVNIMADLELEVCTSVSKFVQLFFSSQHIVMEMFT